MMLAHDARVRTKMMLLAGVLAGGISVLPAGAQSAAPAQSAASAQSTPATQSSAPAQSAAPAQPPTPARQPASPATSSHYRLSRRAEMYYWGVWGVDELRVKTAESGELIRFNYRVVDPERAAAL